MRHLRLHPLLWAICTGLALLVLAVGVAWALGWLEEEGAFEPLDNVTHVDPAVPTPPARELERLLGSPLPMVCVEGSGPRVEVILANPPSAGPITPASVQGGMVAANTYVNDAASPGGATLKVLCDGTGKVAVTVLATSASQDFGSVVSAVRAAGFTRPNTRYVIVYNTSGYGGNGVAELGYAVDYSGPFYAVVFGATSGYLILHELTHTLSAVQGSQHLPGAPNSTWAGHCHDGLPSAPVMCYNDGGLRGLQHTGGCFQVVYDCNGDDYAAVTPTPGGWLASHPEFNVLSCRSAFIQVAACSSPTTTTTPTSTTVPPPTTTAPPTTTTQPPPPTGLPAPTGLRVAIKTCTAIGIAWNPVAGATRYYASRRDGPSSTWGLTTTVTLPRLNQGWSKNGAYDFRVRAVSATAQSELSFLNGVTRAC